MLYSDALVWTAVFIDWLDWFELGYWIDELIWLIVVYLIDWMSKSNSSDYVRCFSRIQYIVFVDVYAQILYLVVAYFMRYHTLTSISHGCRFHEILHKNCNISRLQISWDITPESQYIIAADFMICYNRTSISHG